MKPGQTVKTAPDTCPKCNAAIGAATLAQGTSGPCEGAISVCAYCQAILRFDAAGELRPIAQETLRSLPSDQRAFIRQLQRALKAYGPGGA